MIKPLWNVHYEYKEASYSDTAYGEIYIPAFEIGEAFQNGTRAIAGMGHTSVTIVHIERTYMRVALED